MIILLEATKRQLDRASGGCGYNAKGDRAWAVILGRYHCYKLRGNRFICYGVTFDTTTAQDWLAGNQVELLQ